MALKRNDRYPGRFDAPTAGQPQGAFKNRSAPDAKDGSYLEKDWMNDFSAFFSSLLDSASIAPNGNVDAVGASQYFSALQTMVNAASADKTPPGVVSYLARNAPPVGYLKANGALVSRTTYAALFAAIGTTWGVGDGSTTFALPDGRGEFIRGWDDGRGVDTGRGFGSAQADDFKSHSHMVPIRTGAYAGGGNNAADAGGTSGTPTGLAGGAETRPRNIALLACIKY